MNFVVLADLKLKIGEREEIDKYLDIAREVKMLVKIGIVPKELDKKAEELNGRIKTINATETVNHISECKKSMRLDKTWWGR